jgi:hypothetical protein
VCGFFLGYRYSVLSGLPCSLSGHIFRRRPYFLFPAKCSSWPAYFFLDGLYLPSLCLLLYIFSCLSRTLINNNISKHTYKNPNSECCKHYTGYSCFISDAPVLLASNPLSIRCNRSSLSGPQIGIKFSWTCASGCTVVSLTESWRLLQSFQSPLYSRR